MSNLLSLTIFMGLGAFFVFFNLLMGKMARPRLPSPEKSDTYECGETPIGSSWVQFDLRFYIIALVFLVFDVEIALFYPWATIYNDYKLPALLDMLTFFAILLIGYAYLWRFGYLEWVRSHVTTALKPPTPTIPRAQLKSLARKDPELTDV